MSVSIERQSFIGSQVDLKGLMEELAGVRWTGNRCNCPFGSDSTPSFYCLEDKHFFYCHHCHKGYSAVWITSLLKKCSTEQAARWLERKYNILQAPEDKVLNDNEDDKFQVVADFYCKDVQPQDVEIEHRVKLRIAYWEICKQRDPSRLLKALGFDDMEDFEWNTTEEIDDAD